MKKVISKICQTKRTPTQTVALACQWKYRRKEKGGRTIHMKWGIPSDLPRESGTLSAGKMPPPPLLQTVQPFTEPSTTGRWKKIINPCHLIAPQRVVIASSQPAMETSRGGTSFLASQFLPNLSLPFSSFFYPSVHDVFMDVRLPPLHMKRERTVNKFLLYCSTTMSRQSTHWLNICTSIFCYPSDQRRQLCNLMKYIWIIPSNASDISQLYDDII